LHAEPEFAGAFLVLENDGAGDATGDDVPGDRDYSLGGLGELGEGIGEEVEVIGTAAAIKLVFVSYIVCSWKLLTQGTDQQPSR
jgi:hypothetical protein